MSLDLNGQEFKDKEIKIFNKGETGKAKNVKLTVEKKELDAAPNHPDYRIVFTDEEGSVNTGFYREPKNEQIEIKRLLHVARAVLGKDYQFPKVNGTTEAIDVLVKLIRDNSNDKLFNVFVTHGNEYKPSKYLGLRYFDFVESSDTPESESKLFAKKDDIMDYSQVSINTEIPTPDVEDTSGW